jgi:predicted permease
MILRETRRFFRSNLLLGISGIVVLALGIGTTALALALLFSFSSLAYPGMQSNGFATVAEETEGGGSVPLSWRRLDSLRANSGDGVAFAKYSKPIAATLEVNGAKKALKVAAISSGFFNSFTSHIVVGRDFTREEESRYPQRVVILGSALAVSLFQSPANALEQTIMLNGYRYEVIGVAPPRFHGVFGETVDAWVPAHCVIPLIINLPPEQLLQMDSWKDIAAFYGVAASDRLSSSSLTIALSSMLSLRAVDKAPLHISQGLTTDPIRDMRIRKWLRLGFLLALFFTIVSSLNYGMLLMARTPRYVEEARLKMALGASGPRLMTELTVGPVVMVSAGLALGAVLCISGMVIISRISLFYGQLVRGSWQAAVWALSIQLALASTLTLVIALVPALGIYRAERMPRIGYTTTSDRHTSLYLRISVIAQIAFCVGTSILAGMIASSFLALMRVPLGYSPDNLTVVRFAASTNVISATVGNHHSSPEVADLESVVSQFAAIPGTRGASYATGVPFNEPVGTIAIQRTNQVSMAPRTVSEIWASPGYLASMNMRLLEGSGFSSHGIGVQELIVNRTLAKELWPNESPINQSVQLIYPAWSGIPGSTDLARVVGVVEDVRLSGYAETPVPTVISSISGMSFMDIYPKFVVRGSASSQLLREVAVSQASLFLPEYRLASIDSISEQLDGSLSKERQRTYFALAGAILMAIIAYVGLYGSLSYFVNSRRRELAVRIALGASPWAIRKMVLRQAAQSATIAVLLSIPMWPLLARLSSTDYLGQVAWSTSRAVLIAFSCAFVSVIISLAPAAGAASVSPTELLKEQ